MENRAKRGRPPHRHSTVRLGQLAPGSGASSFHLLSSVLGSDNAALSFRAKGPGRETRDAAWEGLPFTPNVLCREAPGQECEFQQEGLWSWPGAAPFHWGGKWGCRGKGQPPA